MKSLSRLLALVLSCCAFCPVASAQNTRQTAPATVIRHDPQQLFQQGEAALKKNNLDAGGAIFPRRAGTGPAGRRRLCQSGRDLYAAQAMAAGAGNAAQGRTSGAASAGIRLNIGLAYYRQNNFRAAIAPFESVVHDVPDSYQARYLLGLCYFFTERYADAITMLEPLWPQASNQLNYLYVLGIAAGKSSRPDLEQRALGRLAETGQDSPESICSWARPTSTARSMTKRSRSSNSPPRPIRNCPSFTSIWAWRTTKNKTWSGQKRNS